MKFRPIENLVVRLRLEYFLKRGLLERAGRILLK
jgi:hypothetical protein